ncbi:plant UBX domain-containing protein 4-like [Juglans microcarpa x Juglans regia]|uniref:plant UBX domain-containing protein 4-like n=1 Tax=Juglans microcarpa x Juglans regia TaxID=2249226 RepID=UPI001B7E652D|nr:plant UBX domain-containing protein 4-like [Juglans microcarpa x Juglans regia]
MLVQDPSKANDVDTIFNQARQLGAVEGPLNNFVLLQAQATLQELSIRNSECPKELEPADRRSSVHVNLIRRNENCPRTPEPTVASTTLNSAPTPSTGLVVDEALPSTSIQLRLADGTRMVAHINYHHTINDIRSFIDASRPGGARNYHLQMMGFPPKLLGDSTQTIEQANLANSVVIQKF